MLDWFSQWLGAVDDLGPLAPVAFIATVTLCECIPLFPTQPLSLSSGLLFGATAGSLYNLIALCTASTLAFTLSRTIGKGVAQEVIAEEGGESGATAGRFAKVQQTIRDGTPVQQFVAILLLRLTPIVPFSASNYMLGLTPVKFPYFIAATVVGMTVWATVFASVGAVGRELMTSGMDISAVMAQVGEQAGEVSEKVLIGAGVLGAAIGIAYVLKVPNPVPEEVKEQLNDKLSSLDDATGPGLLECEKVKADSQ